MKVTAKFSISINVEAEGDIPFPMRLSLLVLHLYRDGVSSQSVIGMAIVREREKTRKIRSKTTF